MIDKVLNELEVKTLRDLIKDAMKIVLTCHVRPDGDAIGSTQGFAQVLRTLGKEVSVVIPDMAPRSLNFITEIFRPVIYTVYPDYAERLIKEADLILCCDFNCLKRLDRLAHIVEDSQAKKVLIDHHPDPEPFADLIISAPEMSSASELVFRLIAALDLYDRIDTLGATSLLTGIVTDTRNFSVNCSRSDIYEIMRRLMDKGADKGRIVREALELRSLASLRLQAYAIYKKMEIFLDHGAAIITLDENELKRFDYERGDSEGLVNKPLEARGVIYSVFMRQDEDCIKISARSVNEFPVSRICQELYGGGGHIMAAGGEYYGSLEECRQLLINAMPYYDSYLPKKKLINKK